MFSSLSLKGKLMSAFLLVTGFMIVISGFSQFSISHVVTRYQDIFETTVPYFKFSALNSIHLRDMHAELLSINNSQMIEGFNNKWRNFLSNHKSTKEVQSQDWKSYEASWSSYLETIQKYIAILSSNDPEAQIKSNQIKIDLNQKFNQTIQASDALFNQYISLSSQKVQGATTAFSSAGAWSIGLGFLGITLALVIGYFFAGKLSKTIISITEQIDGSAKQTSMASQDLTSASVTLSQGSTESAASLEETVSSLEELSSMVKLNSDHAKEANSLSQKSLYSAENGEKEISKLITAMSDMAKSSKKIEEIINVIDDIAFQTNLLALNAAVEAARAGEQGKGFAVVADAVRNLAQRSASAAKDINLLIKETVGKTEEGVKVADSSGTVLKEIVTSVKKVADLNSEISAASLEQANGIEQISRAMNHLDQAIQTNASSSEQVASAAQEMNAQADCFGELVDQLTLFSKGKNALRPTSLKSYSNQPKSELRLVKTEKSENQLASVLPLDEDEQNIGQAEGF
jgi:methyl-accepting chemotaxis protein